MGILTRLFLVLAMVLSAAKEIAVSDTAAPVDLYEPSPVCMTE